ncbi:hypothetical protein [Agromyces bauzanensis]
MNTSIRDALRRAGGRDPSGPAGESFDARRRWRTTLAGVVVATMALGGMTALAAAPAAADELPPAAAEQATPATDTATPPADEPAPATEDPAPTPAEDPATAPAEEPAAPVDQAAPPADVALEPADEAAAQESAAEAPVVALLVPPGDEVVDKVEICHRTDSYKNPYVINEPNANGDVDGHATEHVGPVFYPEIPKHTEWGDIIPPFYYGDPEDPSFFPGLNWDAEGQAIYENDCVVPTEVPELVITPMSCVEGGPNGQLDFTLGPLLVNLDYRVIIWDSADMNVAEFGWSGVSGEVNGSADLPPGDYTITVEQSIIVDVWELIDEQSFTIEECLAVEAVATGCSLGDDGTALVSLSGLIVDEDYDWSLMGDGVDIADTLTAPSESLDVPFGDLPPGSYTFTITWTGNEEVTATATFFVEPCQPVISVVVTECPAYGGEGSALLKLSNLVEGVEYDVWVTAKGDEHGTVYDGVKTVTGDATHVAEVDVSPLAAGKDYTAWVHAVWADSDDEFELHASADFSLKPCPAAPAKPVTPAGLAVTGTSDPTGPIAAALLLLGLGGAALVAGARREGRVRNGG